jgi:hypothetical protein
MRAGAAIPRGVKEAVSVILKEEEEYWPDNAERRRLMKHFEGLVTEYQEGGSNNIAISYDPMTIFERFPPGAPGGIEETITLTQEAIESRTERRTNPERVEPCQLADIAFVGVGGSCSIC